MTCILRDLQIYSEANLAICGNLALVCRQIGFPHTEVFKITAKKAETGFIATGNTSTLMNLLAFVHFG